MGLQQKLDFRNGSGESSQTVSERVKQGYSAVRRDEQDIKMDQIKDKRTNSVFLRSENSALCELAVLVVVNTAEIGTWVCNYFSLNYYH